MSRNKLQVNIARLMALCLALLLIVPVIPARAAVSGECGNDVTWTLEGGTLTVIGSGAIRDYSEEAGAPWAQYGDQIHAVVVKQGVQSVGAFAFYGLKNLTSVTLPQSVKSIGTCAFYGCKSLTVVNMTGVKEIGDSAFEQCSAMTTIRLPDTLKSIGTEAFYRCENLVSITIPVSVTQMGGAAFAYCHNLRTAIILANMTELPYWTFYGCYALENVQLSTKFADLGEKSLTGTKVTKPEYSNEIPEISISDTKTETQGDTTVTTDTQYRESNSVVISTVVTTTANQTQTSTKVQIDAFVNADEGWQEIGTTVSDTRYGTADVKVNVWLTEDSKIKGEDLGRFAGKNVKLTIHTTQGTQWHINGGDIDSKELEKKYDLSYSLSKLSDPDEQQAEALTGHEGFVLKFHGVLNFKVEVELPIGRDYSRDSAVFFAPDEAVYLRRQAVMVDDSGMAHFYLGYVETDVSYLIGINVPQKVQQGNQNPVSDVIIPDSMKNEYPNMAPVEEIEYIITGRTSSLGVNIQQLTLYLVGGMVGCALVVGVVIRMMFKRKLKRGYVPDMRYTDEQTDDEPKDSFMTRFKKSK